MILRVLRVSAVILCLSAPGFPGSNETAIPFQDFLQKTIGLTKSEIQAAAAARPIAKVLKTETDDEVAIFGIIRIYVPQELFVEKFRNITEFENGTGIEASGLFHSPPAPDDVATLSFDDKDLKEIPKCKPGSCQIKLSDKAMRYLQTQINWKSPQAHIEAQSVIRKAFSDYVREYQQIGDKALALYYDTDKPQSIAEGLDKLMEHSSNVIQYDPVLADYLENYPNNKPQGTDDIFYWQKGAFGLKPVVRASHLVIHRTERDGYITYAIASKMLFASHYFRSALELKSVVPDSPVRDAKSFYLVCINRSYVDGLTGIKGSLIRGTIKGRSRDSLSRYLADVKQKLESAYRAQQVSR